MKKILSSMKFLTMLIVLMAIFGCGNGDSKSEEVKLSKITIIAEKSEVEAGKTITLKAVVEPADSKYDKIVWSVENDSMAAISQDGILTAKTSGIVGNVTVTAKSESVLGSLVIKVLANRQMKASEFITNNIFRTTQSGIIIKSSDKKLIYIDPVGYEKTEVKNNQNADIIIITHEHSDHYSLESIKKISNENTTILVSGNIALSSLTNVKYKEAKRLLRGESYNAENLGIKAIAAYNIVTGRTGYHPNSGNGLGVILTLDGVSVYHAGDTDRIPEMKGLNVDIACLPVGGTYTMTATEAKDAAIDINPLFVIPMHYADVVGSLADASKLAELMAESNTKVVIKEKLQYIPTK